MSVKPRLLKDVNKALVQTMPARATGILDACNIANEIMESSTPSDEFLIGDRVMLKLNLITKRQMRKGRS